MLDRFLFKIYWYFRRKYKKIADDMEMETYYKSFGHLGNNVKIYHPIHAEPRNNVFISDNVSIAPFVQIWALDKVVISKNVMIASHAIISSSTHDYKVKPYNSTRIDKAIHIGENAWIGSGAIIFPGVTIGANAVVGAGAVVRHDVPENAIVAGNPSKIVKYVDDKDR
jgi:maltose O-acetyltransferase